MKALEESNQLQIDFGKLERAASSSEGLVPVAVQDADSGEVILLAYTNERAFRESMARKRLILWSSSRNELWEKGATSGNAFELVEVFVNCEQNSLLYKVRARKNGICHTNNASGKPRNCFYRRVEMDSLKLINTDP